MAQRRIAQVHRTRDANAREISLNSNVIISPFPAISYHTIFVHTEYESYSILYLEQGANCLLGRASVVYEISVLLFRKIGHADRTN